MRDNDVDPQTLQSRVPLTPFKITGWLVLVISLALIAAGGWTWYEMQKPLEFSGDHVEVRVAQGSTARSIARQMREAGIEVSNWQFVVAATLTHATRSLRSGRYRIDRQTSLMALVDKLQRGAVEREQLTIVEGSTFVQLREVIAHNANLRHESTQWSEAQILKALGVPQKQAEGLFAPDTYSFDPGASDLDVLRQAYATQRERLERAWQARAPDLPYANPYEALVMASIIEKETGQPQERGAVAAVFVNRQRLGMPLQTDPAVIYGLGTHFDGHLHKRDLQSDTPYNTYTRAGLPPTPISLPGRAAIDAALNPDASKALYFVARGDGTSEFSLTLADHNRAVARYQLGQKHLEQR